MRRLLFCGLLWGLALSQASAKDTTTIAAFGDSLFAGYGIAPQDALPAQLEAKLLADGYHVKVINDGVSGDTTAGGVARVGSVIAQKPAVAIVELGANDMMRGLPGTEVHTNMELILAGLRHAGIKVLVIGQKAPISYGVQYAAAFNPLFCELARKYDAGCYPVFFDGIYGHPDLMQDDGIHPNAQGVKVVLGKMYPYVVKMLKK